MANLALMAAVAEDLPFERVWLPYIYLYGLGGVIFFTGLWMVLRSQGFSNKRPADRKWIGVLVFGFFWYAGMHGVGILAATHL